MTGPGVTAEMGSGTAPRLWGQSAAMTAIRAYLPKLAGSNASVLIRGETGTGKEGVARAIHQLGPRSSKPFVAVNCAALPDTLVESELFGHERGAFTGAHEAHAGKFEQADGGTLFLDEIGEMPFYSQAKLLRVIESREVTPVGSRRTRQLDVRIIAATNQSLDRAIAERRFRADLYFRLGVAQLELPPLRERLDDLDDILERYIALFNDRQRCSVGRPDTDLRDRLKRYSWPGNIRELRNLVEAVFIDPPDGRLLSTGDLPPHYRQLVDGYRQDASDEREAIAEVLRDTNWNKAEAAKRLQWSRMTLYRKLAKYEIEDED